MTSTSNIPATLWLPKGEALSFIAPELAIVATIVAILLWPIIGNRSSKATAGLALLGAAVAAILAYRLFARVADGGWAGLAPEAGSGMLLADNFSVFFKLFLIAFLFGVTMLWLIGSARREKYAPEFFTLLLGSALGMILMVSSLNLLMLLLAVELASLPSYAIVGFDKRSRRAAEASLKYVIFGAVSAAIMLYGASLLYGYYGTLDVGRIAQLYAAGLRDASGTVLIPAGGNVLVSVGMIGVLAGVAFKISAVPFHFWCPDVFEGATIEVTTWLSVASKAAGLGLLLRLVYAFTEVASAAGNVSALAPAAIVIGVMAAVTCTVGNLAAYRQDNVKRLLAYSSIAHAGYMMCAGAIVLAVSPSSSVTAIGALIFYVSIYLFMNLGAFGTVALVYWKTGSESIDAFNGLGRRATALAVMMSICLFSLIGLPPLAGFAAKWWLLWALGTSAMDAQPWLWWLVMVVVINTLLSLWYYMRIIIRMFLVDDGQPPLYAPIAGQAVVTVCAAVMLIAFIFQNPIINRANRMAGRLFTPAAAATQVDATPDHSDDDSNVRLAGTPTPEND